MKTILATILALAVLAPMPANATPKPPHCKVLSTYQDVTYVHTDGNNYYTIVTVTVERCRGKVIKVVTP